MSPWLFAVIFRPRVLVTETFTSSRTWVAPLTTSKLESLTGEGADGTPGYTTEGYAYTERAESQARLRGTSTWVVRATSTGDGFSTSMPADGCGPVVSSGDATYDGFRSCSYYTNIRAATQTTAPTTGASATGFGQTFAGGAGGPATPSTVTNVAVTAGASYSLVIPSGGSLSLTYYR